jgi:outer membrane receptor protein involved in Fe transport
VDVSGISSGVSFSGISGDQGIAQLEAVPIGKYTVVIEAAGFAKSTFVVTVSSDRVSELHAMLRIAGATQTVEVNGNSEQPVATVNPQSNISRAEISRTPGADRTNSLSFITDFVPGSYVVHDQLHVRGGHQVTWAVDGVPIPNTNIASNVGPQFDPKDVEFIEAQRGSYMADYGDRTYGVFNVAPRSGFERKSTGELVVGYGSYNQTDNQLSFGDHTNNFAYYVSANGNRSDYGLEPPTYTNLHNQSAGGGVFTSMTYNRENGDQVRFVGSGRTDFYQVPNDPTAQDAGMRDRQREQDAYSSFTYLHPFNSSILLSLTPFFHFNRAAYEGGASDVPSATDNRASTYFGGQASTTFLTRHHSARVGFYGFGQHDSHLFSVAANDGGGDQFSQTQHLSGSLEAVFVEDQYRPTTWLTTTAGVRFTHFSGGVQENATNPRLGAALTLPRVRWVLRGSYSRFYQAPPLSTVSGPLLNYALQQGVGFLPLHGERDEQVDVGLTIPFHGWSMDADAFRTAARNFFDHDALGNSNIFLPLTIGRVRIRGIEASLRSPKLFGKVDAHLAYSHQSVQGYGAVTGGLTDFSPPPDGFFYLDHDQRNTLSAGFTSTLPLKSWFSFNANYGSGFLNGDGPDHLPSYATFDLAIGKAFGERFSAKLTATNVSNERHYIDLSNTFGGSHVNEPRMVTVQVRYTFPY